MALYKLCEHKDRARDRCKHVWWGSYQHRCKLYRTSLGRWANVEIGSKTEAEVILDRFREAVWNGTFREGPSALGVPLTFAIEREYLDRTPFKRGTRTLVRQEPEDNRRHRRIGPDEERRLLELAGVHLKPLIVTALDTGLRCGEMLALTWADAEARPGWLRLRGETTKSGKTRWVPVATSRLVETLAFLKLDAEGQSKAGDSVIFADQTRQPIQFPRAAWHGTILRTHGIEPRWVGGRTGGGRLDEGCRVALHRIDLHWHDLRHEYASRLVERGVPLSQVRDLLGHASIVTTERYDNQREEVLLEAAKRLETGESFRFFQDQRQRT